MLDNGQVPSGGFGSPYLDADLYGPSSPELDNDPNVIHDEPPPDGPWLRRSFWVRVFESARQETSWVRANRFYTSSTAAQIASDIRSAHNRDLDTLRIRGILAGEQWEARWGVSPECPAGSFVIWVKYLGKI